MAYLISDAKDDLGAMLHGGSINDIENPYGLFNRAARQLLMDVDLAETKRVEQIGTIFQDIYNYTAPVDLKGDKIIDVRPQVNRDVSDNFSSEYTENFDLNKSNNTFSVEYDSGSKIIRLSKSLNTPIVLNGCDSLTGNGTWSATADCENLVQDKLYYTSGSASLRFDLSGAATTGYLENSTMTSVDLSDEEDIASLFLDLYLPDASILTSVALTWGSDSSNYWSVVSTTPYDRSAFQNGWNTIKFDWNGATETGSPVSSAVDYIKVLFTYSGTADTDLRIDNIRCVLGQIYEIVYYSKYLFKSSGGTWKESVSDDSDIVNLDTDSYNLFIDKCMELAAQQLQGEDSAYDVQYYRNVYKENAQRYKQMYKSELEKKGATYYNSAKRYNFGVKKVIS
jgi:hypothetical protein